MLPKHGKLQCRECFGSLDEDIIQPHPKWRMINDLGSWGSECPEYLVLGFSKGATQADIYKNGKFEDITFAKMRTRLTQALYAMGILSANEAVDEKINKPIPQYYFWLINSLQCVSRR